MTHESENNNFVAVSTGVAYTTIDRVIQVFCDGKVSLRGPDLADGVRPVKGRSWFRIGLGAIAISLFAMCSEIRSGTAAEAPGAPGIGSVWTTGAKQGLGTSTTIESKVWYTIQQGILGEVYYPQVDVPNVQDLQFIITDGNTFVDLERDATEHRVTLLDAQSLTYRQVNTKPNRYRLTKTYITDTARPTLLIETRFQILAGGPYQLYVLYNPSLRNSGMGDIAATSGNALVASDGNVASALISSSGFAKMSSGYSGTPSDGYRDLNADQSLDSQFDSASTPGNIVQVGQVSVGNDTNFTLALGFGSSPSEASANANASLAVPFAQQRASYENGWHNYMAPLTVPNSVAASDSLRKQYNVALMTLKAHEDKTFRGANVASLTQITAVWLDIITSGRVISTRWQRRCWQRVMWMLRTVHSTTCWIISK